MYVWIYRNSYQLILYMHFTIGWWGWLLLFGIARGLFEFLFLCVMWYEHVIITIKEHGDYHQLFGYDEGFQSKQEVYGQSFLLMYLCAKYCQVHREATTDSTSLNGWDMNSVRACVHEDIAAMVGIGWVLFIVYLGFLSFYHHQSTWLVRLSSSDGSNLHVP